jgi:hypothetical protein
MPAITITPANVRSGADADYFQGYAGAAVTAGMAVYQDRADAKLRPATNAGGAGAANVKGIALHGAGDGQPLRVQTAGTLAIGGTTVVGAQYSLGTAGAIVDDVDVVATQFVTTIGVGGTNNTLKLAINASGQREV